MADYTDIVKAFADSINGAEVAAVNRMSGLMKRRIHNTGDNATGGKIGNYSSATWIAKRKSRGRQVAYVDLEFEGDLRSGYGTGITDQKENCIGYFTDAMAERAAKMEALFGQVFYPSESEIKDGSDQFDIVFDENVRNALRS